MKKRKTIQSRSLREYSHIGDVSMDPQNTFSHSTSDHKHLIRIRPIRVSHVSIQISETQKTSK